MNDINSFTFYKDYYYLIDTMPIEDKKELAVAILDYVFKDLEPDLNGHNQAIFNTLSRQLDCSKNKSKSAKKIDQAEIKQKSNENQTEIKSKSKQNQMKIKQGNKTSVLSFKFYISNLEFLKDRGLLRGKIEDWLDYKWERKEPYKETGLKSLMTRIEKYTEKFGEEKIVELIDECMANNYKGIIFEKLDKQSNTFSTQKSEKTESEKEKIKRFENAHSEEATPEEMKELDDFFSMFE